MPCPPLDIYERVAVALKDVAPTFRGKKFLLQQDAPRRFVWVFTGEDSAGAARVGGNPRSRHADAWALEVHCWGESFEEAYRLRQALITALREQVSGSNYRLGRTVIMSDEEHTAYGDVFVVALTLITPLADAIVAELRDDVKPTGRAREARLEIGDVLSEGTAPPRIVVTGTPLQPLRAYVEIQTPGPRETATFRYSLDGGLTWEATGIRTAEPWVLHGTGLTLHFGEGIYSADNRYAFAQASPVKGDGLLTSLEA